MKFVVTGVAGFIGSQLALSLLSRYPGAEVVGIDSLTDYYSPNIKQLNASSVERKGGRVLRQDLLDIDLPSVLQDCSAVFHQAGQPGVRPSWGSSFIDYLQMNVLATQRLLEALRGTPDCRLIYASSSSVYGNLESYPAYETNAVVPMSPYGVTKLAAENLCRLYSRNFGVDTVSLRYFTVYGPGQRPDMAFHKFCKSVIDGRALQIFGDGTQVRDFTYVEDVVAANIAAFECGADVGGEVFNICGGGSITVNDVISLLGEICGRPVQVERVAKVPGDVFETGGSNAKAREVLGWAPTVDVAEGLRYEYEWISKNRV